MDLKHCRGICEKSINSKDGEEGAAVDSPCRLALGVPSLGQCIGSPRGHGGGFATGTQPAHRAFASNESLRRTAAPRLPRRARRSHVHKVVQACTLTAGQSAVFAL